MTFKSSVAARLVVSITAILMIASAALPAAVSAQKSIGSQVGDLFQTNSPSVGGAGSSGRINGIGACSDLGGGGFEGLVDCAIAIFNYAIYIVMTLTVIYIMIGAFNMISSEEKREDGKTMVYHGIIGLFAMVSIWGFVNILDSTFKLSGDSPRTPPPIDSYSN